LFGSLILVWVAELASKIELFSGFEMARFHQVD